MSRQQLIKKSTIDKDWFFNELRDIYDVSKDMGRIDYCLQALALVARTVDVLDNKSADNTAKVIKISDVQDNVNDRIKQLIK